MGFGTGCGGRDGVIGGDCGGFGCGCNSGFIIFLILILLLLGIC